MTRAARAALRQRTQRLITRIHRWLYRATGGRIGHRVGSFSMLLLTTTGARTGQSGTVPVAYAQVEHRIVIAGSNGGSRHDPAWTHNLRVNPDATLQIRDHVFDATADFVSGIERDRLFVVLDGVARGQLSKYQQNLDRTIPIVAFAAAEPAPLR